MIRAIIVSYESSSFMQFEIFERLNRGSMGLNEQELRNCVYRGPFCDLLAELEKETTWRRIKGGDKPEPVGIHRLAHADLSGRAIFMSRTVTLYGGFRRHQ